MEQHGYEFEIDVDRRTRRSPRQDRCGIDDQGLRRAPFFGIRACQAFARRDGWRSIEGCLRAWRKRKSRPEIPQSRKSRRDLGWARVETAMARRGSQVRQEAR